MSVCPPLGRDPARSVALRLDPVAEPARVATAVHARPAEHVLVARCKHLQVLGVDVGNFPAGLRTTENDLDRNCMTAAFNFNNFSGGRRVLSTRFSAKSSRGATMAKPNSASKPSVGRVHEVLDLGLGLRHGRRGVHMPRLAPRDASLGWRAGRKPVPAGQRRGGELAGQGAGHVLEQGQGGAFGEVCWAMAAAGNKHVLCKGFSGVELCS